MALPVPFYGENRLAVGGVSGIFCFPLFIEAPGYTAAVRSDNRPEIRSESV